MKYKTAIFDLDGTITDSGPGIMNSIRYALKKRGLPELPSFKRAVSERLRADGRRKRSDDRRLP